VVDASRWRSRSESAWSFTADLTKVTALIPTHNGQLVIRETLNDRSRPACHPTGSW
jgi:hypothetical protein